MKKLVLLVLCAVVSAPVAAETVSRTVDTRDLNLGSSAGVAALDRRIKRAVNQVCGTANLRGTWAMAGIQACRAEAFARANTDRNAAVTAARAPEVKVAVAQ